MPLFPFTTFGASRASNPTDAGCVFTYCYGGAWAQGKVGNYGLTLTGSGNSTAASPGYIVVANNDTIKALTNNFSIATWLKSTGDSIKTKTLKNSSSFAMSNMEDFGMGMWAGWRMGRMPHNGSHANSQGRLAFVMGASSTEYAAYSNDDGDSGVNTDGEWHHLVGVRDDGTATLYIDGVAQTETIPTAPQAPGGCGLVIGRGLCDGNNQYMSGSLDEVAVWDVPLSPGHISSLAGGARADSFTPPVKSGGDWSTGADKKIGTYAIGSFDGSADYLSGSWDSNIDFDRDDAFSYSFWVKTSQASLGYLLQKAQYTGGGVGTNVGPLVYISSGIVEFQLAGGPSWGGKAVGTTNIADDAWHHVCCTYNGNAGSNAGLNIYVDASNDVASRSGTPTTVSIVGKPLEFGRRNRTDHGGSDAYFAGYVDDIAIWNVELDSGAVTAVSSSGTSGDGALASGVSGSNLKAYWSCEADGPVSTTISGSNGLDMTMMGGLDGGTTGSLLLYYDFEIGDSNIVSGNFPSSTTIYDANTASFAATHLPCTGTITNMASADFGAWDQGKIGKYSLNFSGTADVGDSVEVANNSAINFTGDMTVAGWVYSSNQSFLQGFVAKEQSADVTHNGWLLGRDTSGGALGATNKFYWTIRNGSYDAGKNVFSDAAGPDGGWAHLVGTRRNGDNYLYVNGVQQADTSNQSTIGATTCALRLGQWWDQSDAYPLVGNLDEVSIWSGSLSDANIDSLHSGSKANAITPTVADAGNWVTGKIGDYALEFDGASEVVNVPSGSGLSTGQTPGTSVGGGSESFTVSAWVYQDTWTNWDSIIARKNATWYNGWGLTSDGSTSGEVCFWFGGFNSSAGNKSYATISTGQWHHLVGTYDPSASQNGQVQIWVDGVAQPAVDRWVTASGGTPGPDTGQTEIGEFWNGKIDDIGCWNVVLDSGAIADLSGAAASSVSSSNLTSYWSFDSGGPGSSTLTDSSTLYTNNGTLSGMSAGTTVATLAAYYDFECNGPGNSITKDLSGNDLSGTLTKMKLGTCGSG